MSLKFKFGVMQGRLTPIIENRIQIFPKKNWEIEFQRAKDLDLKYIEWTLDYDTFKYNPILKKSGINKIRHLSNKTSVKVKSLTGDCFMQKPFWKTHRNNKLIKDFKKILVSCNKVGIKYIIVPLVDNGSIEDEKTEKSLIQIFKKLKTQIKKKKIQILFESNFSPKKLKKFMLNFDKSIFGINYDLGNSASKNYNFNSEKKYFKFVKNIHLKDRRKYGHTVRFGDGNANFKKMFSYLIKNKNKYDFTLQPARSKCNKDIEEIKLNIEYIKQLLLNL